MSRKGFAAPQALAVLSCALALMIAHPMVAHADTGTSPAVVASLSTAEATVQTEQRSSGQRSPSVSTLAPSYKFFSSARRLHVLATMEILHRMLLSELRPNERQQGAVGIDLSFATLCAFEQPIEPSQHFLAEYQSKASVEGLFIRVHSQLAPPTA
jgi:hypothetical protein